MKIYVDGQTYCDLEYDTKQNRKYIYTNDGIYCYKKELQKSFYINYIPFFMFYFSVDIIHSIGEVVVRVGDGHTDV